MEINIYETHAVLEIIKVHFVREIIVTYPSVLAGGNNDNNK